MQNTARKHFNFLRSKKQFCRYRRVVIILEGQFPAVDDDNVVVSLQGVAATGNKRLIDDNARWTVRGTGWKVLWCSYAQGPSASIEAIPTPVKREVGTGVVWTVVAYLI